MITQTDQLAAIEEDIDRDDQAWRMVVSVKAYLETSPLTEVPDDMRGTPSPRDPSLGRHAGRFEGRRPPRRPPRARGGRREASYECGRASEVLRWWHDRAAPRVRGRTAARVPAGGDNFDSFANIAFLMPQDTSRDFSKAFETQKTGAVTQINLARPSCTLNRCTQQSDPTRVGGYMKERRQDRKLIDSQSKLVRLR